MDNQLILSYESDEVTELSIGNTDLEIRSWSLFAILLSIGRPVPPIELASRCTTVEASQNFVEFVCSLPNSPLSLSSDGLVTVSSAVIEVLQRFLLNSNRVLKILLPRELMTGGCRSKRAYGDADIMYCRKRRRLLPNVTGRTYLPGLTTPVRISNACGEIYIHVNDIVRSLIMKAENPSVGLSNNDSSDEMTVSMPSLIKFDAGTFNNRLTNSKHEGDKEMSTILSIKEIESKNNFLSNDNYTCLPSSSSTISGGIKDHFQFLSSFHLTARSLFSKELCTAYCQTDDNKVISRVTAWINNDSSRENYSSPERHKLLEQRDYECFLDSANHKVNIENLSNKKVDAEMTPQLSFGIRNNLSCNYMTPCQEVGAQNIVSPTEAEKLCMNEAQVDDSQEEEKTICGREAQLVCSPHGEENLENYKKNSVRCENIYTNAELDLTNFTKDFIFLDQKHLPESNANSETVQKDVNSTVQKVSITTNMGNEVDSHIEQKQCRKDKRTGILKQKVKPTYDQKTHTTRKQENTRENKKKGPTISLKGNSEPRELPLFDSFIAEEEEGAGGYGTVYKARSKQDGTTFAVKYPHVNANRHHVCNEIKMLERFGGKSNVIKFEGSFKCGNSHCLVLEHVAHDRPEVLKKEIDESQLRWYGYCLFRALASLHKQGVVHRDVKPGNFLFSLDSSKGYLIDFNLATDLHQKSGFSSTEKSKSHHDKTSVLIPPSHPEPLPPSQNQNYTSSKALLAAQAQTQTQTQTQSKPKNSKKKREQVKTVVKNQNADGSGITSTKEATSNRIPSAEQRFKQQPIPSTYRKELLNLVHHAMQQQNHDHGTTSISPSLKRKRVAATPAKLDNKFFYLTPMPLHCNVSGVGLLKNKGEGKQRKEGSCVGTKGFRAPEVLLKSTYQGPKVDIWSAGVTLLYFIIGRSPFTGDPDQNIKEIAKLRGSEDLWEVAKLHDRESSFPPELLQIQSLPSTKLHEWCKQNTKRPDFRPPRSLIDLVDKCLTVNPRLRITAEDALMHDFFAPCFEDMEKRRKLRRSLESQNSQLGLS